MTDLKSGRMEDEQRSGRSMTGLDNEAKFSVQAGQAKQAITFVPGHVHVLS